ncbi:RidA family protein [Chryseosolibacter indicus]|uniref:RidA family protein n=1 Tax=Chryseosolibacter indicus TaxID=2782351 RepID=A0ABS5VTW2_9BACT|nr:RidA family protein [Chryseosolibacter indicus]MBT1704498.1 RidA family protein [Chryseosolibacter indicus]
MTKTLTLLILLSLSIKGLTQTPEEKLNTLGITLPQIGSPIANYVHGVQVNNLIFLSGKGPLLMDGKYMQGKLGKDVSMEKGYEAARLTAIQQISVLKNMLGDLRKVKRIVKVNGFVNSEDTFYDHPKVVNGFSDLMVEVFGEKGKHARTALGVNALPLNMIVEVECIVEVEQ